MYYGQFESLVNSSSGKTLRHSLILSVMFESLVNSSSGKTEDKPELVGTCLRALLIQVVVKQKNCE